MFPWSRPCSARFNLPRSGLTPGRLRTAFTAETTAHFSARAGENMVPTAFHKSCDFCGGVGGVAGRGEAAGVVDDSGGVGGGCGVRGGVAVPGIDESSRVELSRVPTNSPATLSSFVAYEQQGQSELSPSDSSSLDSNPSDLAVK